MGKTDKKTWASQIVLFVAFLIFGVAKFFVSPEQASQVFGKIGGSTFQYITAAYQVISAILVIIPSTAFIGALLIVISMSFAILLHIFVIGFSGPFAIITLLAIVLLLLGLYVMKKTRKNLFFKK